MTTVLESLIDRHDAAAAAVLADPRVARDPDHPLLRDDLQLFAPDAAFPTTVIEGWVRDADQGRLSEAVLIAGVVALGVSVLRAVTVGISFGDALLLTFAVLIPAWLSPRAVVITILAAVVVGGAVAVAQRIGRSKKPSSPAGVALGPALLAGWTIGVVVG